MQSLGLDRAAVKFKKDNPAAETLPPTLELWVQHSMSKLHNNFFDVPASGKPVVGRGCGLQLLHQQRFRGQAHLMKVSPGECTGSAQAQFAAHTNICMVAGVTACTLHLTCRHACGDLHLCLILLIPCCCLCLKVCTPHHVWCLMQGAPRPKARPAHDDESEPEEVSVEEPRASFNTSLRGRGSPGQFSGGAGKCRSVCLQDIESACSWEIGQ
jgi:hypothetical protein